MSRPRCLLWCAALLLAPVLLPVTGAQTRPHDQRAAIGAASELFDLFGMGEAFFERFRDGESWNEAENEPLAGVLMRLPQIRPLDLERWSQPNVDASDVAGHPAKYCQQFLRLEGKVRRVTRVTPSSQEQERYDLAHYFRCEILLEDTATPAVVFARNVPNKWQLDAEINETAGINALFLKTGSRVESSESTLYFAADRVAWHPDTLAGRLGLDYGLFDSVQHDGPITAAERECFYQLLDAAGNLAAEGTTSDIADATTRLVSLMARPESHVGELHSFRGIARRAIKVHINDPDTINRFGFDHYFELVVFVDLDGYTKVAGRNVRNYPVVFCLRELPAEMPAGENIAEMVRASGFLLKKWKYRTQLRGAGGLGVSAVSPLLIGHAAVWEPHEQAQGRFDPLVAGVCVTGLACVALFAWWYRRRERRIYDAVVARRRTSFDSASLENVDVDSIDGPTVVDRN